MTDGLLLREALLDPLLKRYKACLRCTRELRACATPAWLPAAQQWGHDGTRWTRCS